MKIISGGQTGADQGALKAGVQLGFETGGTAPPNFMTEQGSNLSLKHIYNLVEGEPDLSTYVKRTIKNVMDSDATVWFGNENSNGRRLTLRTVSKHRKLSLINPTSSELRAWVESNDISVLNVAGNRESKSKGVEKMTYEILIDAFR